jgi:hypothetical protein
MDTAKPSKPIRLNQLKSVWSRGLDWLAHYENRIHDCWVPIPKVATGRKRRNKSKKRHKRC